MWPFFPSWRNEGNLIDEIFRIIEKEQRFSICLSAW